MRVKLPQDQGLGTHDSVVVCDVCRLECLDEDRKPAFVKTEMCRGFESVPARWTDVFDTWHWCREHELSKAERDEIAERGYF